MRKNDIEVKQVLLTSNCFLEQLRNECVTVRVKIREVRKSFLCVDIVRESKLDPSNRTRP